MNTSNVIKLKPSLEAPAEKEQVVLEKKAPSADSKYPQLLRLTQLLQIPYMWPVVAMILYISYLMGWEAFLMYPPPSSYGCY